MAYYFLLILILLTSTAAHAIPIPSILGDTYHHIGIVGSKLHLSKLCSTQNIDLTHYRSSIKSSFKDISTSFHPSKALFPTVSFWYLVFGKMPTSSFIIHHEKNLSKIYQYINCARLHALKKEQQLSYYVQNLRAHQEVQTVRARVRPKYRQLIRIQTGQNNFFNTAIQKYKLYSSTVDYYFDLLKAPREFLAVPFLESHFNHQAVSLSGAVGLWQFMEVIGNFFMPSTSDIDYRLSPYLSTLAGIHLLKQNKMILKRWDLAVLAYNTGVTQIRKERKKIPKLTLTRLIRKTSNEHFGFAAKNYYSEFYAILMLLIDNKLFAPQHSSKQPFLPYITTCTYDGPVEYFHNPHLKSAPYPKNTIIFYKEGFKAKCLKKVSKRKLRRKYPKGWL